MRLSNISAQSWKSMSDWNLPLHIKARKHTHPFCAVWTSTRLLMTEECMCERKTICSSALHWMLQTPGTFVSSVSSLAAVKIVTPSLVSVPVQPPRLTWVEFTHFSFFSSPVGPVINYINCWVFSSGIVYTSISRNHKLHYKFCWWKK